MNARRWIAGAGLACSGAALSGCLERTVTVNSNPPGAVVWLNDTEVGRTPLTTGFIFYGDYDVRLQKEGYEPVSTHRLASAPMYEWMPIDLAATALPVRIKTKKTWDFDLTPEPPPTEESRKALIQRAHELGDRLAPPSSPLPPPEPTPAPAPDKP
jgi:hypothetical protein